MYNNKKKCEIYFYQFVVRVSTTEITRSRFPPPTGRPNVSITQPEDGPHVGPKQVVVFFMY